MRCTYLGMVGVLAVAACGDDGGSTPPDAPVVVDGGGTADAPVAEPDAEDRSDHNDSFGEATTLTVGGAGAMEVIQAPGDKDYYTFTTTAPGWFVVDIEANLMDDPEMLDSVITLYDAAEVRIAENDDAVPRVNTDPEVITYLPAAGTFYVEVQEYGDWTSGIPEFGPDYIYTIRVIDLAASGAADLEPAADPGDTIADAVAVTAPTILAGFFNTENDVEVYAIPVAAGDLLQVAAMPDGDDGYGSTADIEGLWVTDVTGTTIVARIDASEGPFMGPFQIAPPAPAGGGTYLLWLDRSGPAGGGANDFWVAKAFAGADVPLEAEPPTGLTNDTAATAEVVAMVPQTGFNAGQLRAELSTPGDVDYFAVTYPAGHVWNVFCWSSIEGSGVLGLSVSVRRGDDSQVTAAGETATAGVQIIGAAMEAGGGTGYLRLTKTGQSPEVTGAFVRCNIFTFQPM